jgi:hypothetical protein
MNVELPPPSRWVRMAGKGEDCSVPQWELSWGETVTVYTDGVEVGEHFHEDLPALRALALATLAAIDYAERQVVTAVNSPRLVSVDEARRAAWRCGCGRSQ